MIRIPEATQTMSEFSMSDGPTVFVVDDDPGIRRSLGWLIESVGIQVETFASAAQFLAQCPPQRPGCLIVDMRMPGMSGLELQSELANRGVTTPVIVVTGYGDVPMAVRAMKHGAIEFLEKPVSDQLLLEHIQRAIDQDRQAQDEQRERQAIQERLETLTPREREVLEMVVAGKTSKEAATTLEVSYKTIEAHRAKIMRKMEATSVAHLIHMYFSVVQSQ